MGNLVSLFLKSDLSTSLELGSPIAVPTGRKPFASCDFEVLLCKGVGTGSIPVTSTNLTAYDAISIALIL